MVTKQTYYMIERKSLEDADVADVLDMLRYDGAKVECNPPEGYWLFSCEGEPELDRWRSFMIKIAAVTLRPMAYYPGFDTYARDAFWRLL